jgi:hypothetical protein
MTLLLSYSQVRDLLLTAGLRPREARDLLAQQVPPPVVHGLHAHRRWHRQVVLDFCARVQEHGRALGEGCAGSGSHNAVNPLSRDVRTR